MAKCPCLCGHDDRKTNESNRMDPPSVPTASAVRGSSSLPVSGALGLCPWLGSCGGRALATKKAAGRFFLERLARGPRIPSMVSHGVSPLEPKLDLKSKLAVRKALRTFNMEQQLFGLQVGPGHTFQHVSNTDSTRSRFCSLAFTEIGPIEMSEIELVPLEFLRSSLTDQDPKHETKLERKRPGVRTEGRKLLVTSASLLVTGALLVVTRSY